MTTQEPWLDPSYYDQSQPATPAPADPSSPDLPNSADVATQGMFSGIGGALNNVNLGGIGTAVGDILGPPVQNQPTYSPVLSNLNMMMSAAGMIVNQAAFKPVPQPSPTSFSPGGNLTTQGYQAPSLIQGAHPGQLDPNDRVYMGHQSSEVVGTPEPGSPRPTITKSTPKSMTVQQAMNLPYTWYGTDDKKIQLLQKQMRQAGYSIGSGGDAFGDMVSVWQGLVQQASQVYVQSDGKNLVTPYDILSSRKKQAIADGRVDSNGNSISTSTSRSINDLSQGEAWQVLQGTMQQMLGRDPTDQEVRDFLSAANNDASQDPTVTKTTTTTNSRTGVSNSKSNTTGGYTAADAAKSAYDNLHNDADYAKYQSATTYFNAMVSALGEVAG